MSQPILVDESLFDEAFIPERLISRAGQIREVARCLQPVRSGKSGRNIFVYGPPGTGKTSVCRSILNEHFPKQSVYVNCWNKRTTHKIMEETLLQMGQVVHGRESASDLISRFERLRKKVIVCLDESDQMKEPDILYFLPRISCNVVLISNQMFPLSPLDSRIRSSLLLHEVEFKAYSADDIMKIVKERTSYGIGPGAIDDTLLSIVSKMSNGDARVALQTLKIAAKEADSKDADRITIDDVRHALKYSRKYRLSYLLGKLSEHQRTIYEILKHNGEMNSGSLFDEYSKRVKNPLVDRSYRNHMERMEELGLVKSDGSGRWKRYTTIS